MIQTRSQRFKTYLKNFTKESTFNSFVILVMLVIINASLQSNFFSYNIIKSNFITITPLVLLSMAQGIVILSGNLDLSVGAGVSLLTVIMASLMTDSIFNVIGVVILGIVAAVVLGVINGALVGYVKLPPLIATFSTSAIFFGLALFLMPLPGGYVPKFFYRWFRGDLFGLGIVPVPIFILLIGIGIWLIIKRTAVYRYIYAVGSDEERAYSSGIKVSHVKFMAYVLAGLFLALAGISVLLSAAIGDARIGGDPQGGTGPSYMLNSIAAVLIGGISLKGGKGSLAGAIIGAMILVLLINIIFFAQVSSLYQNFARGMIILISLIIAIIPRLREESRRI
jgi:ribose transport system permease protein